MHILQSPTDKLEHKEFLYFEKDDPSLPLATSLKNDIGEAGTVIVWNKKFECKINEELGNRLPEFAELMLSINHRIFDLMDIFTKQRYVHKNFKGSTSIKYVLPALVPELHYADLNIKEGGTASDRWNKVATGSIGGADAQAVIEDLSKYCGRDTEAMYAIWYHLYQGIHGKDELAESAVELAF